MSIANLDLTITILISIFIDATIDLCRTLDLKWICVASEVGFRVASVLPVYGLNILACGYPITLTTVAFLVSD